jgi:hypothetical protein
VIHRADYHRILLEEAIRLGAKMRMHAEVVDIEFTDRPTALLHTGERIQADVIVGADGKAPLFTYFEAVTEYIFSRSIVQRSTTHFRKTITTSKDR